MSYRNYADNVSHIVDQNGLGDFTTIAAALTAASSGDTIYIREGTYTEDLTLPAGIDLIGIDRLTCIIVGKITCTTAGASLIQELTLQTNSDNFLAVTGSAATEITISYCEILLDDNSGITYSSSSSSSSITIADTEIDSNESTATLYTHSSSGNLVMRRCVDKTFTSTTASTCSAGAVVYNAYYTNFSVSISSAANFRCFKCFFATNNTGLNALVFNSTANSSFVEYTTFSTGSNIPVSIGASASLPVYHCAFQTSDSDCVTGAGAIEYGDLVTGTETTTRIINCTTLTGRTTQSGGISFDGGTNVLDFYEEGTWTPSLTPNSGAFGTITYGNQDGSYTRIGNLVYISADIRLTAFSIGTATGNLSISGQPFTAGAISTGALDSNQFDWDSTTYEYLMVRSGGASTLIIECGDNVADNIAQCSYLKANTRLRYSFCFVV